MAISRVTWPRRSQMSEHHGENLSWLAHYWIQTRIERRESYLQILHHPIAKCKHVGQRNRASVFAILSSLPSDAWYRDRMIVFFSTFVLKRTVLPDNERYCSDVSLRFSPLFCRRTLNYNQEIEMFDSKKFSCVENPCVHFKNSMPPGVFIRADLRLTEGQPGIFSWPAENPPLSSNQWPHRIHFKLFGVILGTPEGAKRFSKWEKDPWRPAAERKACIKCLSSLSLPYHA